MKTTVNPVDTVTSALKDRKLPFKSEEIESAFIEDSNKDENIQWVEEHLSYDTLLSQEELTLYAASHSFNPYIFCRLKDAITDYVSEDSQP